MKIMKKIVYHDSMKAIRLIRELLKENPHITDIAIMSTSDGYYLMMWCGARLWSITMPTYKGLPDSVREDMDRAIREGRDRAIGKLDKEQR